MPFKGFLITPEVASRWGQQRYIARSANAKFATLVVENRFTAYQACAHDGNGLRFAVTPFQGGGIPIFVGYRDVQGSDRQPLNTVGLKRIERAKSGLTVFYREQGFEAFVHIAHDRRARSEVGRDRQDAVWSLREERLARPDVSSDVGTAEAVDRLFGIAHQEQSPRSNLV